MDVTLSGILLRTRKLEQLMEDDVGNGMDSGMACVV